MIALHKLIRSTVNKFISAEFSFKTKTKHHVRLQSPIYIIGEEFIEHQYFESGPGLRIECISKYHEYSYSPHLVIGSNVRFNFNCHIGCCNDILIGDNVLIGSNVLITDHCHGKNSLDDIDSAPEHRKLISKGPIIIEDNVWIGENVCIMPGTRIGKNSIIGALSVVTKDIPPYSVAVGTPAKVIKTLKI